MSANQNTAGGSGGDQPSSIQPGTDQFRLFAVVPKTWCEHLGNHVKPLPSDGINALTCCLDCSDQNENWICLHCYKVYCSRYVNAHMQNHAVEEGHVVALSLADLSVWCFGCESYINNAATQEAKRAAYRSKFGEDFPGNADVEDSEENVER